MTTSVKFSPVFNGQAFTDTVGNPLAGGLLYQWQAGSSSVQETTYLDYQGNTSNQNPIVLDSSGRANVQLWLKDGTAYHLQVQDSLGNVEYDQDHITGTVSGGSPGVSFPLLVSDWSNTTNTEIMWVQDKVSYPSWGDSRIRGTSGEDNDGNNILQSSQVFYDLYDDQGPIWHDVWQTIYTGFFCCDGPTLTVHIPNLSVGTITGINAVTNLSTNTPGLYVSSPTGYVGIDVTRASKVQLGGSTISTTERKLSGTTSPGSGFYLPYYTPNPSTYKFTVMGRCTSTGGTTTFKIRMGYGDSTADTLLASFAVTSAAGSGVPFKAEAYVTLHAGSGTSNAEQCIMSISNQGTAGIATTEYTGFAPQTGTFDFSSGGWLNIFCITNSSGLVITPDTVVCELIL